MTDIAKTEDLFFNRAGLDKSRVEGIIGESLGKADDGELFLEYQQSENFVFDDGQLKNANFDTSQGFGLRAVAGEMSGYAHASELSEEALLRAGDTIKAVQVGYDGTMAQGPAQTNQSLYMEDNPLNQTPFETKVRLLSGMDAYARGLDERIRQFSASLSGSWQAVQIIRADGSRAADIRPLVRLNVSCIVGDGDRLEAGSYGTGGRETYESYINSDTWQMAVEEALRQAIVNLGSVSAPAGEMPVVLGPGWPAILLHEAIGHGLEGDFNRKKTSAFSELVGERVAAPGVTVVDDGTIENRRGSLTVDDEGTPTQRTVLIEDGVLTGYMQDRMNARLMGKHATGNGRRESYAHLPMPRMTNTVMEDGNYEPDEIIKSVKK